MTLSGQDEYISAAIKMFQTNCVDPKLGGFFNATLNLIPHPENLKPLELLSALSNVPKIKREHKLVTGIADPVQIQLSYEPLKESKSIIFTAKITNATTFLLQNLSFHFLTSENLTVIQGQTH